MSRATTRASWVALAALLATFACEPETAPRLMYDEDFETACDGTPCGWVRSEGDADNATWVETIHPGEHGLRLTGDVTVRGPEAGEQARRLAGTAITVNVANRCDLGSTLFVTVVFEDDLGQLRDGREMVVTSPDWTNREVGIDLGMPRVVGGRVVSVILEKAGSGACEVGDIVVDASPLCLDGCC